MHAELGRVPTLDKEERDLVADNSAAVALAASAVKAKTYQVTGPVVEVTDTKLISARET